MTCAPVPYRVVRARTETADTVSLTVAPAGPSGLPPFAPGQFAMVHAFGAGEIPLSTSCIDGPELTHTVRAVGAVSAALCRLRTGDRVGMRGPFGTGWEVDRAVGGDLLVVAGGIGLAPLLPVVDAARAAPHAYGRLNLLVGARAPADLLHAHRLCTWATSPGPPHCLVTVDRPAPGWRGRVGVVTSLLNGARFDPGNTTAFVCGPEVMIRALARDLVHRGLPPHRVRVSLERTMHCGTGHCGHCQLGGVLLCRDGPVTGWDRAAPLLSVREL
ncbi:FAD/NAD(P)-binding protein [Streptomyces tropicalis]|uniref:FAD/NAD(P)-binding protein n=1 Tax=Streptomyces tropicalis TaxID=3034234 RepID=A0ABT6A3B1_9ACTN|nr:FAD/NAD(P)-binding protein [Streptomyces tropicalis]MDF3299127.1 FAD/NAD(P)-binding protein [Streptomyces tropicalis]